MLFRDVAVGQEYAWTHLVGAEWVTERVRVARKARCWVYLEGTEKGVPASELSDVRNVAPEARRMAAVKAMQAEAEAMRALGDAIVARLKALGVPATRSLSGAVVELAVGVDVAERIAAALEAGAP